MPYGGDSADHYYDEAITASMKGELPLAIQHFQQALSIDSEHLPARHQLGKCFHRIGNFDAALTNLGKVLALKPDHLTAQIDLANTYLEMGEIPKARAIFSAIQESDPAQAKALLGLAQCAFEEGHWEEATQLAAAYINTATPSFAALYLLGRAAVAAHKPDKATEAFKQAAKLLEHFIDSNPDKPDGYFLMGDLYFARKEFKNALEQFIHAKNNATEQHIYFSFGERFSYVDIMSKIGLCHQRLGSSAEAKQIGSMILKIDPEHKIGNMLANL